MNSHADDGWFVANTQTNKPTNYALHIQPEDEAYSYVTWSNEAYEPVYIILWDKDPTKAENNRKRDYIGFNLI